LSKNKDKIRVSFPGGSAEDVTGSQVLIDCPREEKKILVECGLQQNNQSLLKEYQANVKKFDFKPKDLDFLILCHLHIDHTGLACRIFAEGGNPRVILPKGNKALLKEMLLDSQRILERNVSDLNKKYKKDYPIIYSEKDVYALLDRVEEYDFNEKIKLDDFLTIEYLPSGHIINSAQCILYVSNGSQTRKICVTSDLGNTEVESYYNNIFQPAKSANLLIGETTYANKAKSKKTQSREKDIERIKTAVYDACIDNKATLFIPVFSLMRTQVMLTLLYDLLKDDNNFNCPIYVCSLLTKKVSNLWMDALDNEEQKNKWEKVMNWDKVKFIDKFEDVEKLFVQDLNAIVLAASGMITAGYSVFCATRVLPKSKNIILFCGYSVEGSIADKIKKGQKSITIDGKQIANRARAVNLSSFSSHAQYNQLMKYYSQGYEGVSGYDKIALVHGNFKDKCEFGSELEKELSKRNKTTKVTIVNKSTEILL